MPKNGKKAATPTHFKLSENELVGQTLKSLLNINSIETVTKHAAWLRRAAANEGITIGTGELCRPQKRCHSLACPICRYRAQHWYVVQHAPLLAECSRILPPAPDHPELPDLISLRILPTYGKLSAEGAEATLPDFIQRSSRLLRECAPEAAGQFCVHLSWNSGYLIGEPDYWSLQVHGIVGGLSAMGLKCVQEAFGYDYFTAPTRLLVAPLIDPVREVVEMARPNLRRYVDFIDKRSLRSTRIEENPLPDELALMQWLAPYEVTQRFFEVGSLRAWAMKMVA